MRVQDVCKSRLCYEYDEDDDGDDDDEDEERTVVVSDAGTIRGRLWNCSVTYDLYRNICLSRVMGFFCGREDPNLLQIL